MQKFIKNYIDQILIAVAALFVAMLVWFFIDSTAVIGDNFSKAIAPPPLGVNASRFELDGAKKLDLRGLSQ